ncbi:signal peptidase I [Candidatus Roizmanbacteria bacterium CG22_combo_CG10-13_8_21_14_all_34_12]|uniref:Signal peptidase I n=1 Tax=Candidatus Roizmanbacteria bacterium CG22_combo_CG10-13_8_21_14_all_34_12 TaxID=1974860 RepID=A0A2H0C1I8_9BACT|nr:MAG: signal peptidase I [Candidatus Roizmanbacteria bacterium CG22_combo_CG10-13_8_21_14_all_34_12]
MNKVIHIVLILLLVPLSILISSFYESIDGKTTFKKTAQFFANDGSAFYMYPSLYWPVDKGGYDDGSKDPTVVDKMIFDVFDLRKGVNGGFGVQFIPFSAPYRFQLEKIFGSKQIVNFNYGDLVVFNKEVSKNDVRVFIQRVIAKDGDKVRFENGYLLVNGKRIDEPYLWKDQSTYSGIFYSQDKFIKSCEEITVPMNHLFVLGDNRIFSFDSTDFGTVSKSEILGYLPKDYQTILSKHWLKNNKINILKEEDTNELLTYINQIRQKKGRQNLTIFSDSNIPVNNYLKTAIENNNLSNTPKNPATQKALQEVLSKNPISITLIEGIYDLDTYKRYLYFEMENKNTQEANIDASKFAFSTYKTEINGCTKSGTIIATFK